MARITVEDCLKKVNNRFALIHMASKRVRQLRKGSEPTIISKNRDIVVSLREIAAGNVVGAGDISKYPGIPSRPEGLIEAGIDENQVDIETKGEIDSEGD